MSASDEQIGSNLQELRGTLSQANLAAAMAERGHKWSQATVWSVEVGKRPLRLAEAVDVAEILRVEISALVVLDESDLALVDLAQATRDLEEADDRLTAAVRGYWKAQSEVAIAVRRARKLGLPKADAGHAESMDFMFERMDEIASEPVLNRLRIYVERENAAREAGEAYVENLREQERGK